jgi:hypothetical protein
MNWEGCERGTPGGGRPGRREMPVTDEEHSPRLPLMVFGAARHSRLN